MPQGTGAIKDRVDPRDYQYAEMSAGASPFNWSLGYDIEAALGLVLPVKDQNGSSSCGGQAWASYMSAIEFLASKTFEERSAKFIYAQTHVFGGGSAGRDNCNLCINQGVAQEKLTPSYDNAFPPSEVFMQKAQDISQAARIDAKSTKSLNYANVVIDVDHIAQAIRDNGGVVIGLVGQNNGTWSSEFPNMPTVDGTHWYHWVYAGKARLINGVKYIGFLNSWGIDTGENGWQWIPEDYIKMVLPGDPYGHAVWQVWTMVYNPAPVTTFKHTFLTDLTYGKDGDEIRALQMALQADGVFPKGFNLSPAVYPKALYLDLTRQAVLAFQLKYKVDTTANLLALNGKTVGPKTRAQLNKLFS